MAVARKRPSGPPSVQPNQGQSVRALRQEIGRLRVEITRLKRLLSASVVVAPAQLQPSAAAAKMGFPTRRDGSALSRRLRETLELLLTGETERSISEKTSISFHTVHDYVKALYKYFGVSSRPNLIASSRHPLGNRPPTSRRDQHAQPHGPTATVQRMVKQFQAFPPRPDVPANRTAFAEHVPGRPDLGKKTWLCDQTSSSRSSKRA
jgi:DNA-binding CsgD family transcriptional regulator